jgi:hypothetical protein
LRIVGVIILAAVTVPVVRQVEISVLAAHPEPVKVQVDRPAIAAGDNRKLNIQSLKKILP